jgi:hypothetical protein
MMIHTDEDATIYVGNLSRGFEEKVSTKSMPGISCPVNIARSHAI